MQERDIKKGPLLKIPLGEGKNLYRVKIECYKGVDTDKDSQRRYFLSLLLNSPNILNCGAEGFDTLKIFFEEGGWVAVAEAVIEEGVATI